MVNYWPNKDAGWPRRSKEEQKRRKGMLESYWNWMNKRNYLSVCCVRFALYVAWLEESRRKETRAVRCDHQRYYRHSKWMNGTYVELGEVVTSLENSDGGRNLHAVAFFLKHLSSCVFASKASLFSKCLAFDWNLTPSKYMHKFPSTLCITLSQ